MGELLTPYSRAALSSGIAVTDGVYGNISVSDFGMNFENAVSAISENYSQVPDVKDDDLLAEVKKVAEDIASLSDIPYDVVFEFLKILISITDKKVMQMIVDVTEITDLLEYIGDPYAILGIRNLYKIAFLADAIMALLNKLKKFYVPQDTSSLTDLMDSIVGKLGGSIGDFATPTNGSSSTTILGLQLSKLIHGTEIPMGVQANNPNLTSPSILGKLMFGEAPSSSALIDMNQLFAKPIAIFGDMNGGAGNSLFGARTTGSTSSPQSMSSFVSNALFSGTIPQNGTFAKDMFDRILDNLTSSLNVKSDTQVEMKRGDNAIPVMSSLAEVMANIHQKTPDVNKSIRKNLETITSDKNGIDNLFRKGLTEQEALQKGLNSSSPPESPLPINIDIKRIFGIDVFAKAWTASSSVLQYMQSDKDYNKVLDILKSL